MNEIIKEEMPHVALNRVLRVTVIWTNIWGPTFVWSKSLQTWASPCGRSIPNFTPIRLVCTAGLIICRKNNYISRHIDQMTCIAPIEVRFGTLKHVWSVFEWFRWSKCGPYLSDKIQLPATPYWPQFLIISLTNKAVMKKPQDVGQIAIKQALP